MTIPSRDMVTAFSEPVQLTFTTFPSLAPHHDALEAIVKRELPPGEAHGMTREDLHRLGDLAIGETTRAFAAFATKLVGRPCVVERLWALVRTGDSPEEEGLLWHNHVCALSMVYYVRVPRADVFPAGAFSFLAPDPVHVMPREGMAIAFDHRVFHDGSSPRSGTRIVLACDFEHA
jgi:hypothetical protein